MRNNISKLLEIMRRLLNLIIAIALSLTAMAQGTVYFGNINDKLSIGTSRLLSPNEPLTFSIMQMSKSKNFNNFSISATDMDGNDIPLNLVPDTTYHMKMDSEYAHQQDYRISTMEYIKLQTILKDTQVVVYINGVPYNGAAFVGILASLQSMHTNFHPGGMPLKRGNIWTPQNGNPMLIRYTPQGRRQKPHFIRFTNR